MTLDCGGDCCCRVAARVLPGSSRASLCTYPLIDWLVYRVFKRRMMNTQHWSRVGKFRVTGANGEWWVQLLKTDVEKGMRGTAV